MRGSYHCGVNSTALPMTSPPAHLGLLLREWRTARRLSQLDLALDAGVSTRHLSCVETGKSQPSRDMLSRLADALNIPLRDRNALLIAAGFVEKPCAAQHLAVPNRFFLLPDSTVKVPRGSA